MVVVIKNLPANAGDIRDADTILGWEDPLEEGLATHASILTWRIPWTKESGGLQSIRVTKSLTRLKWLSPQIEYTSIKIRKKVWSLLRPMKKNLFGASPLFWCFASSCWCSLACWSISSISAFIFTWLSHCVRVYLQIIPFYRNTCHMGEGPPSWNNICNDTVSK